jgi:SDR family mycofactocin-dependent oxidoreductase
VGKLDGQVAIVTGGARGQGRAHALRLASEGADIAICDIADDIATVPYPLGTSDDLKETERLVNELDRRCLSVQADVRDTGQIAKFVDSTINTYGQIDILVANAGVCAFGAFWDITDQMWDDMIATDLSGVFKTMRAVVPHMIERGYGRIVATSSMGGRYGNPNLAHYIAAKWGVIGLVKSLALEVADKGITVNAICPSTVNTQMVHNPAFYGLFAPDLVNPTKEQVEPRYVGLNKIPIPWVEPDDVSGLISFLVSHDARYITGSTLDIGAGQTASMP